MFEHPHGQASLPSHFAFPLKVKVIAKVEFCPTVASPEHQNRLASLSPWLHLHLPGEYHNLHLPDEYHWYVIPGAYFYLHLDLLDAFFPSRTCCSFRWHFPVFMPRLAQNSTISTYLLQALNTLFGTCLISVFFFLQSPFSSSFSLRVWLTNSNGSSRRRSMLC